MNFKTALNRWARVLIVAAATPVVLLPQAAAPSADADANFVQAASAGGIGELRLAQLAEKQGASDLVKQLASHVVADQTRVNGELETVAAEARLPLAKSVSAKDGAFYGTLAGLTGNSFDGVYVSAMVTDYREDVKAFQKEVDAGKNQTVRDFAQRALATLKENLQLAENAAAKLGVDPTATGGR